MAELTVVAAAGELEPAGELVLRLRAIPQDELATTVASLVDGAARTGGPIEDFARMLQTVCDGVWDVVNQTGRTR